MVCLLTPTVAARWIADRPRLRRSAPRLVSISGIFVCGHSIRNGGVAHIVLHALHWYSYKTCVRIKLYPLWPMLAALSSSSFGQAGKAELFGTIQDPRGLAVAT